jgi:hypothetical protein
MSYIPVSQFFPHAGIFLRQEYSKRRKFPDLGKTNVSGILRQQENYWKRKNPDTGKILASGIFPN